MAAFLTNEAKLFESLSLKGGVLKKKELLQALILAEELFENELFVRNLLKEEAKNLAFITHNLKAGGSNPPPATICRLQS